MGGTYNGGNQIISPGKNPDWFGTGNPQEGSPGPAAEPIPLSAATEQEIGALRRSIVALENQLRNNQADLSSEKTKLIKILSEHNQPVDKGL